MTDGDSASGLFTVGRIRTDCITMGHQYMQSGDPHNHKHLRFETERYYDSLEDGSDAKNDLKKKWDTLSYSHNEVLKRWQVAFKEANPLDKHDLWDQKIVLLFQYEIERFVCMEHNYHYFKTYWDM